jgi:hypothetical protein
VCVQKSHINVVEWIADAAFVEKSYINFLYNQPDWGGFVLTQKVEMLTASELIKFMDMFSREKRSRGLDVHELSNLAKNYFRYFIFLLAEKKVEKVLFSVMPIIGVDYLCYLAAQRLKIPVVMCYQSIFSNRFFFVHDINDFGYFKNVASTFPVVPPEIDWGYKKDLFYMKGAVQKDRKVNAGLKLLKDFIRYGVRKSKKPMRFSGALENYRQAKEFDFNYRRYAQFEVDLSISFVYFPLHLQPELTTSGMGGQYSDQLDAIEKISQMIPSGWMIYVKENPKQGFEQRGVEFFNRIRSMANVTYLRKDVSTYLLMERCKFVATITGTAGWECITGGKPALVFGLPWYGNMPGITRYEFGVSVENVLSNVCDQNLQRAYFAEIYSITREGIVDDVYTAIYPNYKSNDNVDLLVKFLKEVIV